MDNLKARINNATFHITKLRTALSKKNIKVSVRYDAQSAIEDIRFSILVGKHKERWLIRIYPKTNSITFSGGVTKTFFGHNLWVFNNEYVQLVAIIGIVTDRLSELDGITLPDSVIDAALVERVELTNHFVLPQTITQSAAIDRTDKLFMVLFPGRRDRDGDTLDKPGTTSIGKSKSTKVCRVYDPSTKFAKRPLHIPPQAWAKLTNACKDHLRIETILHKRDIEQLGLQTVAAWEEQDKIQAYLMKKYQHYGLTIDYKTNSNKLLPDDVQTTNPTFVEYARHWFTNGKRGTSPNKRSGAYNRFRKYMLDKGFNINVPFDRHQHLTHGLHDILKPDLRADLSINVRSNEELFSRWWERTES